MRFDKELLRRNFLYKRVIEKHITVRECSLESGLSVSAIFRIEHAEQMSIENLCKALEWLGEYSANKYFGYDTINDCMKKG